MSYSAPIEDPSYISELRRALIDLPEQFNFRFQEGEKRDLRKGLFRAISCGGKYFNWFFPEVFSLRKGIEKVHETLESDVQWSFLQYDELVANEKGSKEFDTHAYHKDSPCARIFRRGEPIYKCLTCGFDETCALCSNCYQAEQHEGHTVHVSICQRENGGVCDCGDPEAWVSNFTCKYASGGKTCSHSVTNDVPTELALSFKFTIGVLLDYIIDVMSQSDLHLYPPRFADSDSEKYSSVCTLSPQKYGYGHTMNHGVPSETYSLIAYNDQVRHFRDAVQRIHLASKKVPEFAVMVAEQIQSHGRATVVRSRNYHLLLERQKILSATGLASCIRNTRDEIRENMCHEIILWLNSLTEREMFKRNETLKSILCESFCCKWQPGLLNLGLNGDVQYVKGKLSHSSNIPNLECVSQDSPHWSFTPSLWDVEPSLREECDYNQSLTSYTSTSFRGSRFQYMVYFDIRFWKSIRSVLHDFYLRCLITNLQYKKVFACQYVDIYPVVADSFLSIDGEPELNVMSNLSSQLFTCPSHSTSIISHGDVSRIFSTVYNFLRSGQVQADAITSGNKENLSMSSLKNRRWGQIFFDMGYILSWGKDRELISTNSIIPMACDIISLFQGKPVLKREKEHHVEYESTDYTAFFHAISVVYQFAEYMSQSITNLDSDQRQLISSKAINYVVRYLLNLELGTERINSRDSNEVDYGQKYRNSDSEKIIDNAERTVSFLHPLHSFLSWLIEFSNFKSFDELYSLLHTTIAELITGTPELGDVGSCISIIFNYPIQTVILSSQIKSGFWVRNGFSVRSQLQLYKNTSLREQGYMRDLFLVQVFTICSDPDTVMSVFLKKWLFHEWTFESRENSSVYEPSILQYIVEECLSFFMHILTEDVFLRGLSTENTTYLQIRSEIVHNLCFGPLNYSKLCSQIPEHIYSEKKFDVVLDELTVFKKSRNPKDTGIFVLREEFFDEVNPYYFNYTANKKDDAIKLLKERISKATNIPVCDVSIAPKRMNLESFGIYKYLANFTTSKLFIMFLARVMDYINSEGVGKLDGLLETLLHLIHVCAMEDLIDIDHYGFFFDKCFETSSPSQVSLASSLYHILIAEDFKAHHAKVRAIFKCFGRKHENLIESLKVNVEGFQENQLELGSDHSTSENKEERKKRIAKGRQAKLIAKFKKQQSSFSKINNMANDCSDIEMGEEEEEGEGWKFPEPHCILCQDTTESAGPFGIITYVSKSAEFREVPFDDEYWFLKAFSDRTNLSDTSNSSHIPENYSEKWSAYMDKIRRDNIIGPGFSDQKLVHNKLVSSTCGHGMHFHCYMQYSSSNKSRQSQITRNNPESFEHREFLCPLCKAINNMFIPILWSSNNRPLSKFVSPHLNHHGMNPFDILSGENIHDNIWLSNFCTTTTNDLKDFSILTNSAQEMIGMTPASSHSKNFHQFRVLLTNMFQILSSLTFPHIYKADCPKILINSIKSTEISLRGTEPHSNLVIYQLSNNTLINLRALNEFRLTSLLMKFSNCIQSEANSVNAHIKYLSNLQTLTPEFFNNAIIYSDFFEVLVTIFPSPSVSFTFNDVFQTCFTGLILQNLHILTTQLLKHEFYSNDNYNMFDIPYSNFVSESDAAAAVAAYRSMRDALPASKRDETITNNPIFGYVFFSMILKSVTPFLRRSAIYAYVCCANTDNTAAFTEEDVEIEADVLCSFLKIPRTSEILRRMFSDNSKTTWEAKRFSSFKKFLKTQRHASSEKFTSPKTMEYPGLIRLANLPERLDDFFTEYYYSDKYQSPYLKIDNPAICLFCAEVMDAQKRAIGSPYGQCSTHFMRECVSSVGIFMLPKDRCVLLLHKNGGTFHDAPYIDNHGELPAENKKGRTVHLSVSAYEDFIKNAWLQHNLPNMIVRKLDSVIDAGGWDTL